MAEVLYRKWRPRTLEQVVGQEAVTQTLRNAVTLGRIAHAYLFCGPRGTGKTSTARIMAKAVNCLSPVGGEPDDACTNCMSINEGRSMDLIEIDAASNRGIDDIRDLREKVNYTPHEGKYKVYIIDEVHMMTDPAFNALLKTLEEPPAHAIFVLATTEAHKVPLTIISRCQRFDFRRIPLEAVEAQLAKLCEAEGFQVENAALRLLSRASSGSLRDAENLLEQAMVSYGSPLTEAQVRDLLEMGSDERALELVERIVTGAVKEALTIINEVAAEGADLRQLQRVVTDYLRGVLLIKSGVETSLGYMDEVHAQLRAAAQETTLEHLVRALKALSQADVRKDGISSLPLEMAIVESSLAPAPTADHRPQTAESRPQRADRRPPVADTAYPAPQAGGRAQPAYQPPPAASPQSGPPPRPAPSGPPSSGYQGGGQQPQPARSAPPPQYDNRQPPSPPPASASPGPPARPSEHDAPWNDVLKTLRRTKGKRYMVAGLMRMSAEREIEGNDLVLRFSHRSHMERLQEELDDPPTRRVIVDAVQEWFGSAYDVRVSLLGGATSGPKQGAAQRSPMVRAAQSMGARVVDEREDIQAP